MTWAINISDITSIPLVLWPRNFSFPLSFLLFTFHLVFSSLLLFSGAVFNHRQSCMSYLGETFHWPYSLTKYSLLQNPRTRLHISCYSLVFSAPSNPLWNRTYILDSPPIMQGLFVPFAHIGSSDPVRVLHLFHNEYTGWSWNIYCWDFVQLVTTESNVLLYLSPTSM